MIGYKRILSVMLVITLLLAAMPVLYSNQSVHAAQNSVVAIDTELKDESDLLMFESYGCTPMLKVIDGEVVGITMGGASSAMGYPYMLFGQSNWKDYTLEFTAHDMTRVGGIVRSTGGIKHLDGFGGLIAAYEGLQATPTLTAKYSTVSGTTASITTIKDGNTPTAVMSHDGDIRFKITVSGTSMTCEASYVEGGETVTKKISVDTSSSGKTAGKPGLRAVFRQVNGEQSNGYFSDLKVTLHGYTAAEYRAEQKSDSVVVINDTLKSESCLSMFEGFGCTPMLKVIDGEAVGVTMGGATSAMGYPYLMFGEDHWQDYSLEFDAHGMNRVGAVVRSRGGIAHTDGTGGINVVYEGLQTPAKLYAHYATVDSNGTRKANTITTGDPYSTNFTYDGDMHFHITVKGSKIDCTVKYTEDGAEQSHSITVYTHQTGKTAGKAALRAVFRQVNGEQAEGYFSNLKVTLHGDTATRYRMEHPSDRYVVIKDSLKSDSALSLFEGYGCTPALKTIDGKTVGVTMNNATGDVGYPYLLLGEDDWEDYSLEFTAYGMNRVGGAVRITDPIAQTDGFNGIAAVYEGLSNPGKLFSLYSEVKGTTGTSTRFAGYGSPEASFNVNKNYDESIRFKITVMGELLVCSVTYEGTGVSAVQTISVNTAESGKTAGKAALRAVFRQVNGEQAEGYFSDLKVTLLGDTATRYKVEHPIYPVAVPGDIDGNSRVDNTDITLLVRYLAGWTVDSITLQNADVDNNGKTNNRDAISLVSILSDNAVSSDIYKHVVIVGIDGAGAFFAQTPTPNIDAIFADGAITYNAISTTPSISAQAWTSILHGVGPEYHGRTNQNTGVELYPADSDFPSVFRVIREQMPDASLASISSWTNINYGMIEDGFGVYKANCGGSDQKVVNTVVQHLTNAVENEEKAPALMFIHLTEPDNTGHSVGWGTDAYLQKISYQDTLVKKIYDTYDDLGLIDDTLFILATDHGGIGTSHGGNTEVEMNVMFAAKGKTVQQGSTIGDMEVRDIAAITLHALGLEQPETWTARVPSGLFVGVEASDRPIYEGPESARNHMHSPTPAVGSDQYIADCISVGKLTHYLTFDNTTDDVCGNVTSGHDSITYVEGYFGEGIALKDGYVSIEDFKPGTESFSVTFWMKTRGVSADPAIFSNKDWASGRNQGFVLAINSAKQLKFNVGDGTNRADLNSTLPVDYVDGWVHVTAVVDREAGVLKLAYDFGDFETLVLPDTLKNDSFDSYDVLNIGQDGTGTLDLKLSASLDEFMIFDGALSSEDLASLAEYYGKK